MAHCSFRRTSRLRGYLADRTVLSAAPWAAAEAHQRQSPPHLPYSERDLLFQHRSPAVPAVAQRADGAADKVSKVEKNQPSPPRRHFQDG